MGKPKHTDDHLAAKKTLLVADDGESSGSRRLSERNGLRAGVMKIAGWKVGVSLFRPLTLRLQ